MSKSFTNRSSAIDHASWENFIRGEKLFTVIEKHHSHYVALELPHGFKRQKGVVKIPDTYYENLDFEHIRNVYKDRDPSIIMESIKGAFSTMSNQELLFILTKKIPIEKFIKMELANRGFNHHNEWVGFKEAERIWCK